MRNIANITGILAVTAWVGGMWGVGFLAVPVLFQTLPDKMQAGMLAGRMFTLIAYVGVLSACYFMLCQLIMNGMTALRLTTFRIVSVMLLFTLVSQFWIQPIMTDLKAKAFPVDIMQSAYAEKFDTLHHVASFLYVIQSLLGMVLVVKMKREPT